MEISLRFAGMVALICGGCTFYTNCPEVDQGTGTSGSTGNPSGAGGTGTGGSGAGAGTSSISGDPPVEGEWTITTSNLTDVKGCGVHMVSAKPDEDMLIAGVTALLASRDGGASWQPLGTGEDSTFIENRPFMILYDPDDSETFWEAGAYSWGVYKTTDKGETFSQVGDVFHSDNVSVDFTDSRRRTLLSGAHEQGHTLFFSADGGEEWEDIGPKLPSNVNSCSYPLVLDTDTFLVPCSNFGMGIGGIFRTIDRGENWTQVSSVAGGGNALVASDGAIYWAGESGQIQRSDDRGETWQVIASGFLNNMKIIELPDGSLATMTQQYVVVSADRGETWHPVTVALPKRDPSGLTYSMFQKAFYVWWGGCEDTVPSDALARHNFDYDVE
jgi:photosystem II stability/assembly factor-like uncharacterized protein